MPEARLQKCRDVNPELVDRTDGEDEAVVCGDPWAATRDSFVAAAAAVREFSDAVAADVALGKAD